MSFECQTATVIELVRSGILWVEDGNHGEQRPLSDEFSEIGTPFVRPDDLSQGVVRFSSCDRINDQALQRIRKGKGRAGDIVFTHRATVGRIARVGQDAPNFIANPGVTIYRTQNTEALDLNFLYYFMQTPFFMDQVWAQAGNTDTFPYVSLTQQRALNIRFPGIVDQRKVGDILGRLDDRLTLLRETNATLEGIAQAIFKSWFVDFDPVRAKMEGRLPEGMDEATTVLFPDVLEETEFGLVPKGWKVQTLDKVASFLNGLALQKFPPTGQDDLPVIKIAQLRKGDSVGSDKASRGIKPEYIVKNGDVLFSWSGSLEVEIWCGGDGALNQHLFKVTSKEFPKWFYFFWTRHHLADFRQTAASKATTMGHIQRGHLTAAKVLVPSDTVIQMATSVLGPIVELLIENNLRVKTLSALRDTLLPRLISGQLRIPEALEELETA